VPARAGSLRCGVIAYQDDTDDSDPGWPHDFATLLASEPLVFDLSPDPSIPALIFFTSRSTGPAKGVTHTRESLRWMIASAVAPFELADGDEFLPGSSMSHLGSFLWTLSVLSAG
jgi:long-chain acyl-CoA synthetase